MKSISVVVPVFNQVHLTQRCLPSLLEGSDGDQELILIDNHSTDATPQYLEEFKKQAEAKNWLVTIIRNDRNRGVGAAFNQGIAAAHGPYIALLNNDTWLMPHWDTALLSTMEELKGAMISPYFYEEPFDPIKTPRVAHRFVQRNARKYSRDWASILMFFKREVFEKIGVFDERYFVGFEDRDLKERMERAGFPYFKIGSCFIWHYSKGTRDAVDLPKGYEQESLTKFIEKWGFDPRPQENTKFQRYRRKWIRLKNRFGYF